VNFLQDASSSMHRSSLSKFQIALSLDSWIDVDSICGEPSWNAN